MHDRDFYIGTVEAYFAALDQARLDDVLSFFNDDAEFTVQSAFVVCRGRPAIRTMFAQYLANYTRGLHTDFEHIVDPVTASISSRFRVELDRHDGGHETKHSVNHWYFARARFQRVYVWISGDNVLGARPA